MHVCRLLEGAIKAMLTSLPLVAELHHPAMRPRHWQQLMKARSCPPAQMGGELQFALQLQSDGPAKLLYGGVLGHLWA